MSSRRAAHTRDVEGPISYELMARDTAVNDLPQDASPAPPVRYPPGD